MEYHSSSSKTKFSSAILDNIPSGRFCYSSISSTTYSALSFKKSGSGSGSGQKKSCMCSPTTHPGSFRCSLHKQGSGSGSSSSRSIRTMSYNSHRLNARISAMSNSLIRIDKLEEVLVKRAVAALIRPSSNQQQRRKSAEFRPRPTRLSVMSKAQSL